MITQPKRGKVSQLKKKIEYFIVHFITLLLHKITCANILKGDTIFIRINYNYNRLYTAFNCF